MDNLLNQSSIKSKINRSKLIPAAPVDRLGLFQYSSREASDWSGNQQARLTCLFFREINVDIPEFVIFLKVVFELSEKIFENVVYHEKKGDNIFENGDYD
ncbi:hypothetical protein SAMN04488577_1420 [Bacillus sp. cl95]|nr:hypothetical protein SAMN02799634_107223 [Bacillus sp. UNCCL13]SFQ76332.1 hypothetical protein SAMN04488577_1420 [Bacillus sp. cl95]